MVEKRDKFIYFIPVFISIILAIVYYTFGAKIFLAGLVLSMGGFLSLIDLKIAIFAITFIMPFLPNSISIVGYLGVGFMYFLRRIFIEKSKSIKGLFAGVIAVYLLVIIIQTITSVDIMGSFRDLALHISALAYLYAVVNTIKTKEDLNAYIMVLMASVTFIAFLGIIQAFTGVEIKREWLDVENNPDTAVRVFSVFGNPNILAEYLVIFTPLAMGMFWYTKNFKKKTIFAGCVAVILGCLILTMSRGGWIGIAMAALVFCILVDKRLLLLSIPIFLVAMFILPPTVINRVLSIGNLSDSSNAHRFNIWEISLKVIRDNPIAGVGFGHVPFKQVYESYSRTVNSYHAHNSFLETIAEIGFAGFLVFMTMLVTFIKYPIDVLVKQVKYIREDKYFKYVGVGVAAGLIGVFTHGLVENILYLPKIIFSFYTLVTVGAVAINVLKSRTPRIVQKDDQIYKVYGSSELDA